MPRQPVKIVKNGNAISVSIPRPILHYLGWQLGDFLIPEVLEDQTLRFRRPVMRDFEPARIQNFIARDADTVKP